MPDVEKVVQLIKRYSGFTILKTPNPFCEEFRDIDIDCVQLHSIQPLAENSEDVVGFCGQFAWKDNTITSLDGDAYNPEATVYGYNWFAARDKQRGLDILVGNDW